MRYMLLIYSDETKDISPGDPGFPEMLAGYRAVSDESRARGIFLAGDGLQPTSTATTIRTVDGKQVLLDGPFAETQEQLGGFYMLECKDMDEATSYAARIPAASQGCVEVRSMAGHDTRVCEGARGQTYMLIFYGEEAKYLPQDSETVRKGIAGHQRFTEQAMKDGAFVAGDGLALTSAAVTVRVQDGAVTKTDGPFAETREQLGGFYILSCRDLDEALVYAKSLREAANPMGLPDNGCLEVRPIANYG